MSKVAIVIPARLKSTRLPEKMLIKIGKYSLIQHTYLNALKTKVADKVIVATDSKEIQQEIQSMGGISLLTSSSCPTGTDRIMEALHQVSKEYNIIINVQGDEPNINPDIIDKIGYCLMENSDIKMCTAKTDITRENVRNINNVKVICDKNDNALYFSRSPIPYPRNNQFAKWYKHLGIYGYQREFLEKFTQLEQTQLELSESLEQLRVLENGYKIKVIYTPHDSYGVDDEKDLENIRQST